MKNKILFSVLFVLPALCLGVWSAYLYVSAHYAKQVVVAIKGYDPKSFFSGPYISYTIDWQNTNCSQFTDGVCPQNDFKNISHRYYLPAEAAAQTDRLMRSAQNQSIRFDIVFSYVQGREPIALMLLINNQKWFDYFNNNERK